MKNKGKALVVGAGISGIRAAFDLAETGHKVILIEQSARHGGILSHLYHQFPSNHCGMCQMLPSFNRDEASQFCLRKDFFHHNIEILCSTELMFIEGTAGNFRIGLKPTEKPKNQFQILVVDDEFVMRDSLKEILENEGYGVQTAESGKQALEMLDKPEAHQFQLMFTDIKMPGMDGIELLQQAKALYPQLTIVIMTAYATVETAVDAMKVGALDYLIKPFDTEAAIAMVQKIYHQYETTQARIEEAGAVIIAAGTGYYNPSTHINHYGYGIYPNVITNLEFEQMIGVLFDRQPNIRKIAWLHCIGSRNTQINADFCSSICCMSSIKEAMIAQEKSPNHLETVLFYMDMRNFGKSFQDYYDQAQNKKVRFERARVHSVIADPETGQLILRYVDTSGNIKEETSDMVVLAVGQTPAEKTQELAQLTGIELNSNGFVRTIPFSMSLTTVPGIMAAGSFSGLKDIAESVICASSSALNASKLLCASPSEATDEDLIVSDELASVPVNQQALVIGGGIAGMTAALGIADHGFKVNLIETNSCLGGNLVWLNNTIEDYSLQSLLSETIQQVEQHRLIDVHVNTRVIGSYGQAGCFFTTIESPEAGVENIEHGVTILATGGNPAPCNLSETIKQFSKSFTKGIITQKTFEESLKNQEIVPRNMNTVVMIQCAGSRQEPRNYCSRICCLSSLKHALYLKKENPDINVYILYRDMMTYGFSEAYYTQARKSDIVFIQYSKAQPPTFIEPSGAAENQIISVVVNEPILNQKVCIEADLVVMASGLIPNLSQDLAQMFGALTDKYGFFCEAEPKWRPVDSLAEGVFACGLALSPRSVTESIASAEAAAQRALRILVKKQLLAGKITAKIYESLCSLCQLCIQTCPYTARTVDSEEERIIINPIQCQGCGACAAICPNGASYIQGYTKKQMFAL